MLEAGSPLRNRIESNAPVNVNPRTPPAEPKRGIWQALTSTVAKCPAPQGQVFPLTEANDPAHIPPALVEWKTQAKLAPMNDSFVALSRTILDFNSDLSVYRPIHVQNIFLNMHKKKI